MLTFVSGWRTIEREKAMISLRDPVRTTLFFVDDTSIVPTTFPDAPIIDLWRNGTIDFALNTDQPVQIIRTNYDRDNRIILRAISRALELHTMAQIVITFDAVDVLFRVMLDLRDTDSILAADSRLDASEGDHVIFTHGGSFLWTDHMLESQTAILTGEETLDMGVLTEDMIAVSLPAPGYRW